METVGLHERTCDSCSEFGLCFIDITTQAYICEKCQAFHERALDAAHAAIRETGLVAKLRDHDVDRLAWAAVKAYTEFTDEGGDDGQRD